MLRHPSRWVLILTAAGLLAVVIVLIAALGSRGSGVAPVGPATRSGDSPRNPVTSQPALQGAGDQEAQASCTVHVAGRSAGGVSALPGAQVVLVRKPDGIRPRGVPEPAPEDGLPSAGTRLVEGDTGPDGSVRFGALRSGTWRARARLQGFLAAEQEFAIPAAVTTPIEVTLTLVALARVHGQVQLLSGAPAEGTMVHVLVPGEANRLLSDLHPRDREARRSKDQAVAPGGGFDLDVLLPEVPLKLVFEHVTDGRVEREVGPLQPGSDTALSVTLRPPTNIVGTVAVARPGEPGANVECWHLDLARHGSIAEQRVVVPDDGAFIIRNVLAGEKLLVYSRRSATGVSLGFRRIRAELEMTSDAGHIDVLASQVRVRVLMEAEQTEARRVALSLRVVRLGPPIEVYTHDLPAQTEEELVIRGLPAGGLHVDATVQDAGGRRADPAFLPATADVSLSESGRDEVLVLQVRRNNAEAKGTLDVIVAPPRGVAAKDLDVASVLVTQPDGSVQVASKTTDTLGERSFRFTAVPPGVVSVEIVANGHRGRGTVEVAAGRGSSLEIAAWEAANEVVKGLVRDASGRPAVNARIEVMASSGEARTGPILLVARTDEAGRFEIRGLPSTPGLAVMARTDAGLSMPLVLPDNRQTHELVLDATLERVPGPK